MKKTNSRPGAVAKPHYGSDCIAGLARGALQPTPSIEGI